MSTHASRPTAAVTPGLLGCSLLSEKAADHGDREAGDGEELHESQLVGDAHAALERRDGQLAGRDGQEQVGVLDRTQDSAGEANTPAGHGDVLGGEGREAPRQPVDGRRQVRRRRHVDDAA